MHILIFRRNDKGSKFDNRFESPPPGTEMTMHKLGREEQANLSMVLQDIELSGYDRVVIDLKWALMKKQARTLQKIPNLVIHESDIWFNFSKMSGDFKAMQRFYRKLPGVRVIVTGAFAAQNLRNMGFDAHYVPKSYDNAFLSDMGLKRDISYAFIGSAKSKIYKLRNQYIRDFDKRLGIRIFTTNCKEEYREKLNRIRFFISADVGMNEYMAKNFEAMGCGCLLVSYRQGEEQYLGLRDMENVLLYSSIDEAIEKIRATEAEQERFENIRHAGLELACQRFTTQQRDEGLFKAVSLPMVNGELQTFG